ncbi:MAG: class I SAM-dependent methyltransferase [Saprospiraceae bacterium]|nr:class I SAM-dependent methyltransferase [Saprospiraceae bacterium]
MRVMDHSISKENFDILRCTSCGFLSTGNPPAESESGRYYQSEDYISHSDTARGWIFRIYHFVRNIMLKRKHTLINSLASQRNILDIGSGTGYFLHFMKNKGYKTYGIEIDEQARIFSQKKFNLEVSGPEYLQKNQIKDTFGFITLWHVMEHLYDPNAYFSTFRNLLHDDGHLIIAVPNNDSFDAKHYGSYWAAYDVPRHLWHFTPQTLEKMATNHHFRLIDKKSMPFDPFYNSMLSEKYKGSTLGFLKGIGIGFISLVCGIININKASSVIYIFKKEG